MGPLLARAAAGVVALAALAAPVGAGHEFPFYPSFYPQEITIETLSPDVAARRLAEGSLHVFVAGSLPDPLPREVAAAESLGSYVVVTPNPARAPDRPSRCQVVGRALAQLGGGRGVAVAHPYPVTPFHGDYLGHADRAAAALRALGAAGGPPLALRLRSPELLALIPSTPQAPDGVWDAEVETVELARLLSARTLRLSGWLGPPWLRAGWFHAYLLYRDGVTDPAAKAEAEALAARLRSGIPDPVARLETERRLVALLEGGCERRVWGYTVRREAAYVAYSGGVENLGVDGLTGARAFLFARTVKLKDFPWNGWLTLGIAESSGRDWNPVLGFGDPLGELVWAAVGDPAFLPAPHGPGWVPNRVTLDRGGSAAGRIPVPEGALRPEPGTGRLLPLGPGREASARLRYRVRASKFHDGSRTTLADLLYAYAFVARWGSGPRAHPIVAEATAALRAHLVAVEPRGVETAELAFGADRLSYEVPVVDVYLEGVGPDLDEAAVVAPPWSTVPWPLLVLLEEAVAGGHAAWSQAGAPRGPGPPVVELVRDPSQTRELLARLDALERQRHVPQPLRGIVTPDEAQARWAALRSFATQYGHLLVTNGPYLLERARGDGATLRVFRDLSYPLGVGAFDRLAVPLRGHVAATRADGTHLEVRVEAERLERAGRDVRVVREPFDPRRFAQDRRPLPVLRYVAVAPDGTVAAVGTVAPEPSGLFRVPLAGLADHTVLLTVTAGDSLAAGPVATVPWPR